MVVCTNESFRERGTQFSEFFVPFKVSLEVGRKADHLVIDLSICHLFETNLSSLVCQQVKDPATFLPVLINHHNRLAFSLSKKIVITM